MTKALVLRLLPLACFALSLTVYQYRRFGHHPPSSLVLLGVTFCIGCYLWKEAQAGVDPRSGGNDPPDEGGDA